jgi:hypothetical protein
MNFKDNWLKTDELCPTCKTVIKKQRGITRQNLKRLVKFKWDVNDVVITIVLILVFFLSFLYKYEIQQCRDWLKPLHSAKSLEVCEYVCDTRCRMLNYTKNQELNTSNFSELNFTVPIPIF